MTRFQRDPELQRHRLFGRREIDILAIEWLAEPILGQVIDDLGEPLIALQPSLVVAAQCLASPVEQERLDLVDVRDDLGIVGERHARSSLCSR